MKIKPYFCHWLPRVLKVDAITLYPFIFFTLRAPLVATMKHEMIHVHQVRRLGWFRFYVSYIYSYLRLRLSGLDHMGAYYKIPHEIEAFKYETMPFTDEEIKELFN